MTKILSKVCALVLSGGMLFLIALPVLAQEITIVREIDADNYDPAKTTSRAASEILFMAGDTLVSLAPDMKTISDGLAKSWDVSDDGLTYTFHLKEDVTFCDGRPMTAKDVAYSLNRWIDPETASPVAWRAGDVKSITAPDDKTVVYQLNNPYSELLYQLTQSFGTVVDRHQVEELGDDFGVTAFNGTGPYCFEKWRPRDRLILTRHEGYDWGPSFYDNQGAPYLERIVWQIVPEGNTRTAAMMTGQSQVTQYIPYIAMSKIRKMPKLDIERSDLAFWTYFIGMKIDKPMVSDLLVRKAINLAVNRKALAEDIEFGEVQPAFSYVSMDALDWDHALDDTLLHYNPERAKELLNEDGWIVGDDGVREKDGEELRPLLYSFAGSDWERIVEYVQGQLAKVGIKLRIHLFDATVFWSKAATQEFDMFTMSYPYISAGDALNLYFPSRNVPTPNRMNWKDKQTDEWLREGREALNDHSRAQAYGKVEKKIHDAALWLPLFHEPMNLVQSTDLEPIIPHNIYGCGLYKGLDIKYRE